MKTAREHAGRLATALAASPAGRWYADQTPRDQRVLALLGLFLAGLLIWLLVWVPVQEQLSAARARHAAAHSDHLWILEHRQAAERAAARQEGGARSGQALLSTVAGSARRAGLTLNRFQPEGDNALAVSLDDVAFADLLTWLETLAREEGISVRQASVDAQDSPGRVRARLVLN